MDALRFVSWGCADVLAILDGVSLTALGCV